MTYNLPRSLFDLLVETFGNKEKAEIFAKVFEDFLCEIKNKSEEQIIYKQEELKAKIYNDLRSELATKEFVRAEINEVRAEINEVRAEIKQNNLLLKILIGLSIFGLTLLNPTFVTILEKLF